MLATFSIYITQPPSRWLPRPLDICETARTLSSHCPTSRHFCLAHFCPGLRGNNPAWNMMLDVPQASRNLKCLPACCSLWRRQSCSCGTDWQTTRGNAFSIGTNAGLCSHTCTHVQPWSCMCLYAYLMYSHPLPVASGTFNCPIVSENKLQLAVLREEWEKAEDGWSSYRITREFIILAYGLK